VAEHRAQEAAGVVSLTDHHTSTPAAAAAYERHRALRTGDYDEPERPTWDEAADDGPRPPCTAPCGWCNNESAGPCDAMRAAWERRAS
jgi:hypothetical protein